MEKKSKAYKKALEIILDKKIYKQYSQKAELNLNDFFLYKDIQEKCTDIYYKCLDDHYETFIEAFESIQKLNSLIIKKCDGILKDSLKRFDELNEEQISSISDWINSDNEISEDVNAKMFLERIELEKENERKRREACKEKIIKEINSKNPNNKINLSEVYDLIIQKAENIDDASDYENAVIPVLLSKDLNDEELKIAREEFEKIVFDQTMLKEYEIFDVDTGEYKNVKVKYFLDDMFCTETVQKEEPEIFEEVSENEEFFEKDSIMVNDSWVIGDREIQDEIDYREKINGVEEIDYNAINEDLDDDDLIEEGQYNIIQIVGQSIRKYQLKLGEIVTNPIVYIRKKKEKGDEQNEK